MTRPTSAFSLPKWNQTPRHLKTLPFGVLAWTVALLVVGRQRGRSCRETAQLRRQVKPLICELTWTKGGDCEVQSGLQCMVRSARNALFPEIL